MDIHVRRNFEVPILHCEFMYSTGYLSRTVLPRSMMLRIVPFHRRHEENINELIPVNPIVKHMSKYIHTTVSVHIDLVKASLLSVQEGFQGRQ